LLIGDFNGCFQVKAAQPGKAFTRSPRRDPDRVFSLQWVRMVNRDNTVTWQNLSLQIERVNWRCTLAGCNVIVHLRPDLLSD